METPGQLPRASLRGKSHLAIQAFSCRVRPNRPMLDHKTIANLDDVRRIESHALSGWRDAEILALMRPGTRLDCHRNMHRIEPISRRLARRRTAHSIRCTEVLPIGLSRKPRATRQSAVKIERQFCKRRDGTWGTVHSNRLSRGQPLLQVLLVVTPLVIWPSGIGEFEIPTRDDVT